MKHNQTLRRGLSVLLSLVMCLSLLPATALAAGDDVEINETNFPDENFRTYVSKFDTNSDNVLSAEEITSVTSIDCSNNSISNLKGVEHFTALTIMSCSENQLKELDISKNTELSGLYCSSNQLTALSVSSNAKLISLNCSENLLKTIDVSSNTALTELNCSENPLTELKLENNKSLRALYCSGNQLTELDVSYNAALMSFYCNENQLKTIDVSKNAALTHLDCSNNQLKELDVSYNADLDGLYCSNNQLETIDVSKNTGLRWLYCGENQLTSLDLSENTDIKWYDAKKNSYEIELDSDRTFDLSTLPGNFDVSKVKSWTGGTVNGTTLTVNDSTAEVTYSYDCGKNCGDGQTVTFTLTVKGEGGMVDEVAIDETNFPDENFRHYVRVYVDNDNSGTLSAEEIAKVENIYCSNQNIEDLTGVEHFTALTVLHCQDNQLTSLDLSGNTALTELLCDNNQLTTLDVSGNTALEYLYCSENQLTTLKVGSNINLNSLICSENQLKELDVSGNTALTGLACSCNDLVSLDVSKNTALTILICSENQLTTLDVSGNTALEYLYCSNNQLKELDVSKNTALTYALTYLECQSNQLTALDVSRNTALAVLDCSCNDLVSLNVSGNTALEYLDCSKNQLTTLDVSGNTELVDLSADGNTYPVRLSESRTFDLSTLLGGFDLSKASSWSGGTVNGTTLTVNDSATEVTYSYNCGNGHSVTFTLKVAEGYTITFDANGGSGSMAAVTGVSGSYTLPECTFTAPSGKQFKGWATSASGTVISDTSITVTENTTLYAIWKDAEHSMPGYHAILTEGFEGAALPAGWSVEDKDGDGRNWEIEESEYGYFKYHHGRGVAYSASYVNNVGVLTPDNWLYMPEITIGSSYKLTFCLIAQDSIVEDDLLGVYISTDGGKNFTQIGEDYAAKEDWVEHTVDLSAYAGEEAIIAFVHHNCTDKFWLNLDCVYIWAPDDSAETYTVRFDANGGSGNMDAVTGVSGSYTLPACGFTAPEGKQFKGWATSANDTVISGTTYDVTANTTLYAIWEDIPAVTEYNITVTDGKATVGEGTEISKAAEGTTVTLTANAAPAGKGFDKWIVESGSITLADAESATTTFTMPAGAVSVKATYKDAPHTHSYGSEWKSDADKHWHECSCSAKSEEAAHTASDWIVDTPATATTDGIKHKECTVCHRILETGTIPATGDGTVITYYTLTFDTNGGNSISKITKSEGTTVYIEKYKPTRDGYEFTGWYSDKELIDKITSVKLTKNTTVYAGWKEIEDNPNTGELPFVDVDTEDWFFEDVAYVYDNGLMNGTSITTFGPNITTTRGMIVTILYRLENEPAVSGSLPFDDVKPGSYYENAIMWAAENDIVNGYGNGKFGPDDLITREQMAAILWRYAKYTGYDVSVGEDTNILSYDDALSISEYAVSAMQWACGDGIINGTSATTLSPQGDATRVQVAAILHRFCEKLGK